jgi:hypothetical protein
VDPAGPDMNINMNSMSQHAPASGAHDLDMQLRLSADEISTWTEPLSNLDLSVYTFITQPVFATQKNLRCSCGES